MGSCPLFAPFCAHNGVETPITFPSQELKGATFHRSISTDPKESHSPAKGHVLGEDSSLSRFSHRGSHT